MSAGTQASLPGRAGALVLLMFLAVVIGYSDRVNISVAAIAMREQLGWTQTTKGLVLSAFFVGYLGCMFAGGALATRVGGRRVLGLAVLWWSAWTLLTPLAAAASLPVLVGARICLGAGEAALFPAAYELLGRMGGPADRTFGAASINGGIPAGTVVGLLVTGAVVAWLAWPAAFYLFGVLGVLWTLLWFAMTAEAPRFAAGQRSAPMPWRIVLGRRAVWALVATHFATTWSLYVLLSWLPSWFRDVQGVSIASSGLLSAAPWFTMFLMTCVAVPVSGRIHRATGRVGAARKTIQSIGLLGSAGCLQLAQFAHSVPAALAVVCLATGLLGFCWAGYTANFIDLAPRHSALLVGFSNTIATLPGILGVAITGWLVEVTGTYTAAFALAAGVSVAGALAFLAFGGSEAVVGGPEVGGDSGAASQAGPRHERQAHRPL